MFCSFIVVPLLMSLMSLRRAALIALFIMFSLRLVK